MGDEDLDFTYLDGQVERRGEQVGMGWVRILCRWLALGK